MGDDYGQILHGKLIQSMRWGYFHRKLGDMSQFPD